MEFPERLFSDLKYFLRPWGAVHSEPDEESFIERPIEEALSRLRMIKNMHWNRYDGYCMPAMDVHSSQKGIHVSVEMPGVHKDKVTVDIDKDILTVKGERNDESELNKMAGQFEPFYRRLERCHGSFRRQLVLPKDITDRNKERITAEYDNGLLKIFIPRDPSEAKQSTATRVPVK